MTGPTRCVGRQAADRQQEGKQVRRRARQGSPACMPDCLTDCLCVWCWLAGWLAVGSRCSGPTLSPTWSRSTGPTPPASGSSPSIADRTGSALCKHVSSRSYRPIPSIRSMRGFPLTDIDCPPPLLLPPSPCRLVGDFFHGRWVASASKWRGMDRFAMAKQRLPAAAAAEMVCLSVWLWCCRCVLDGGPARPTHRAHQAAGSWLEQQEEEERGVRPFSQP